MNQTGYIPTPAAPVITRADPFPESSIAVGPEDTGKVFSSVDKTASYNGNWKTYLQRNLRYPSEAAENDIQGSIMVQFIVCEDGRVCTINAMSGDPLLQKEAERVIRYSGDWVPAAKDRKRSNPTINNWLLSGLHQNKQRLSVSLGQYAVLPDKKTDAYQRSSPDSC